MGVPEVYIHFFGDGRDCDPKSGKGHLENLLAFTKEIGLGKVATIVGRYYIMDRDKRWDRVEVGMKGLVTGEGEESSDPVATFAQRYEAGETDEFIKPIIVNGKEARIQDNDTVFFFNTAPTASARSPSFSATRTAARSPTSHTPRTSTSPP